MTIIVEGLVRHPEKLDAARLKTMPSQVDDMSTLVEQAVGRAVAVADIIELVGPSDEATHVTAIAADGSYRASIPIGELARGGWLAYRLGDLPVPAERGGPYRLTVADGTTLCWNVKNVGRLRFTAGPEPDDVPEDPPH